MENINIEKIADDEAFTLESWQEAELTKQIKINSSYILDVSEENPKQNKEPLDIIRYIKACIHRLKLKQQKEEEV